MPGSLVPEQESQAQCSLPAMPEWTKSSMTRAREPATRSPGRGWQPVRRGTPQQALLARDRRSSLPEQTPVKRPWAMLPQARPRGQRPIWTALLCPARFAMPASFPGLERRRPFHLLSPLSKAAERAWLRVWAQVSDRPPVALETSRFHGPSQQKAPGGFVVPGGRPMPPPLVLNQKTLLDYP
jgi:hypothetical protein